MLACYGSDTEEEEEEEEERAKNGVPASPVALPSMKDAFDNLNSAIPNSNMASSGTKRWEETVVDGEIIEGGRLKRLKGGSVNASTRFRPPQLSRPNLVTEDRSQLRSVLKK